MRSSTEEFLYVLLWGADKLARPSYCKIGESFEGWAYRTGMLRYLHRLEEGKLIERKGGIAPGRRKSDATVERIFRLTEEGRLAALGGKDPEKLWNRRWDEKWRLVVYDLPEKHNRARVRLRRRLRAESFGYLQQSVWISPDPLDESLRELAVQGDDVETLFSVAAQPCTRNSNELIVAGSWDFDRIGELWNECRKLLENPPFGSNGERRDFEKLQVWAAQERAAWAALVSIDPFLPKKLLPKGYPGLEIWRLRNEVLREAGKCLT